MYITTDEYRDIFGDLLKLPQDLVAFMERVGECFGRNMILGKLTCDLLDREDVYINTGNEQEFQTLLIEVIHYIWTLDTLTSLMLQNDLLASTVIDNIYVRGEQNYLDYIELNFDSNESEFWKLKYYSILEATRLVFEQNLDAETQDISFKVVELNVLEAVLVDLQEDNYDNALA
eukprot:UN30992